MIPLVFYSHSHYSDVWVPMFSQTDKFLKGYKKYLFTDQSTEELDNDWVVITYDDSLSYQKRMLHCLKQVEEQIILFHHEDMFLYSSPNEKKLKELIALVENDEISIIKLCRASYHEDHPLVRNTSHNDVYENPQDLRFTVQSSICNKEKLETIYSKTYGNSIWEFEANSAMVCDYLRIKTGMTWEEGDNKRGQFHWDSNIYPYFNSAITKGKWNLSHYKSTLLSILEENNVDILERGTV